MSPGPGPSGFDPRTGVWVATYCLEQPTMTDDAPTTATESQDAGTDEYGHNWHVDPMPTAEEDGFYIYRGEPPEDAPQGDPPRGRDVARTYDHDGMDAARERAELIAAVGSLSDVDRRRMAYHLRVQAERMRDDSQQAVAKSLERGADALDPEGGE